MTTSEKMKLGK